MRVSDVRIAAALGALALILSGCSSSDGPVPTTVHVNKPSLAFGSLNRQVALTAYVADQNGDSLPGAKITWSSDANAVATVDTNGVVTSKGNGTANITASSGSAGTIVPVTVAQVVANVTKSGDQQVGSAGLALGSSLSVHLVDSNSAPVKSTTVAWAVTGGGGSVSSPSTPSTASGDAQVNWTLGASGGQTATATVGAVVATFNATALAAPAAGFQIVVINDGPTPSAAVQAAFASATAYWQTAITGDLGDVTNFTMAPGDCATGIPANAIGPMTVDDIVILSRIGPIDGAGGVLGRAGPCHVRVTGGGPFTITSTITGLMQFDDADMATLSQAAINDVIRHEMGHVLGFGTYWPANLGPSFIGFGCLQNASSAGNLVDTYYNCSRGLTVFDSIGGTTYTGGNKVPVENCVGISNCGSGTFNSHWREATFGNELMTGFLNGNTANPLSVLTLAAMQDMGYTVNMAAAESYTRIFTTPPALVAASQLVVSGIALGNDVLRIPLRMIDRNGRLVGVARQQ